MPDFAGKRLTLVLDGVDFECEVWLNGKSIGRIELARLDDLATIGERLEHFAPVADAHRLLRAEDPYWVFEP